VNAIREEMELEGIEPKGLVLSHAMSARWKSLSQEDRQQYDDLYQLDKMKAKEIAVLKVFCIDNYIMFVCLLWHVICYVTS